MMERDMLRARAVDEVGFVLVRGGLDKERDGLVIDGMVEKSKFGGFGCI